ncbi:hypothetical protein FNF29_03293 [Cafeteria roenbergensis]|uniref:Uncharacterized protein n=1 Tax=Cafeteria roenbergensis TaxID=33653 RepID=A0A5A8CJ49_CAFRO|nr:hypothetical protein FNF29_03293 [Cafeteria roenbergensis]|eukprot:KAA0153105.1 hypothetical protein FNF29_03293 [Cafeteria roenbergensis]
MLSLGTLAAEPSDVVPVPPITLAARHPRSGAVLALGVSNVSRNVGPTRWAEWSNAAAAGMRALPGSVPPRHVRRWLKAHAAIGADIALGSAGGGAGGGGAGSTGGGGGGAGEAAGAGGAISAAASAAAAAAGAIGGAAGVLGGGRATFALGGLLAGLGVATGSLLHLSNPDLFELLSRSHQGVTTGVIVGLAGSAAGSADPHLHRLFLLHLPAAVPGALGHLPVPAVTQAVALACLGLLHRGTAAPAVSAFLADQLTAAHLADSPADEGADADGSSRHQPLRAVGDCSAYSLSAGLGLGLAMLGRGGGGGSRDAALLDRLSLLLRGGLIPHYRPPSPPHRWAPSVTSASPRVDVALTARGAAVAIGLAWHRTESPQAAAALALPEELPALDGVRPDTALLRVMGVALVKWRGVRATASWVRSQVPVAVRAVCDELRRLERARCGAAGVGGASGSGAGAGTEGGAGGLADMIMALAGDSSDEEEEDGGDRRSDDDDGDADGDDGAGDDDYGDGDGDGDCDAASSAVSDASPEPAAASADEAAAAGGGVPARAHPPAGPLRPAALLGLRLGEVDLDLCREVHCLALAGAAFGLGLRFAGTARPAARRLLLALLGHFSELRCGSDASLAALRASTASGTPHAGGHDGAAADGRAAADPAEGCPSRPGWRPMDVWSEGGSDPLTVLRRLRPSSASVETARATAAVALGMVMAGTGDEQSLRALHACRKSLSWATTFGCHSAVGAGIGLVMLSAGRATLSRSPEATAALVTSLLPVWAQSSTDNRGHPQPLRALWPVAVDRRSLEVVDAATGAAVDAEVLVEADETDDEAEPSDDEAEPGDDEAEPSDEEAAAPAAAAATPAAAAAAAAAQDTAEGKEEGGEAVASARRAGDAGGADHPAALTRPMVTRTRVMRAPCLLPELSRVRSIEG